MNAGETKKLRAAAGGSFRRNTPDAQIERDAAPVRCDTPRCRNLASACCGGKCWTCQARERRNG